MSDNTTLSVQSGGDVISTEALLNDDGTTSAKVQAVKIMLGDHGKNLGTLSSSNPMPVSDAGVKDLLEQMLEELKRINETLDAGL